MARETGIGARCPGFVVAAVVAAMTIGVVTAPNPRGVRAAELTPVGADARTSTQPRTPFPGFVLDRGRYRTIEARDPGAEQYPFDINDRGKIAGEHIRVGQDGIPDGESGFVRDARGKTTVFDVPGAKGTEAVKLNNRGQLVGSYSLDTPLVNNSASPHGYLLDGGRFIRIDFPGAASTAGAGVNDRGQVVGGYTDRAGTIHGYLWDRGRFTTIDVPGAVTTGPFDINNRGQIVGQYTDAAGTIHGYLWDRGRFTTIDVPGTALTTADGINDRGQIVGYSAADLDLAGARGFLLPRGAKGPFIPISVPGAPRTVAEGINNRGVIVGFYENPDAAPNPQRDAAPAAAMPPGSARMR